MRTNVIGMCYLLHFDKPYVAEQLPGRKLQWAGHYLGWSENLASRLTAHANGNGAHLVHVAMAAGSDWQLARVWEGVDRYYERKLKNRGGRARLCPICQGTGSAIEWRGAHDGLVVVD